jgi:hypothetical protein
MSIGIFRVGEHPKFPFGLADVRTEDLSHASEKMGWFQAVRKRGHHE